MTIVFAPRARADLRKLDPSIARQVLAAVDRYACTGHGDIVRIKNSDQEYRLRVRAWRVRLHWKTTDTLNILRIEHRGRAYR